MSADPLEILEAEHADALSALERLEQAAEGLQANPASTLDREVIRAVLNLLATTVQDHNRKEEAALFPLLRDRVPTAYFEAEHRTLRKLEQELGAALDSGSVDRIADLALHVANLLRHHIGRENEVLFPMAREVLGSEGLEVLRQRLGSSRRFPP